LPIIALDSPHVLERRFPAGRIGQADVLPGGGVMSTLWELGLRFLVGGVLVSAFALLGDLFQPKTFAGTFAAAPSVALATMSLTIGRDGAADAALAARSMVVGAVAFFLYANAVALLLRRGHDRPRTAAWKCGAVWAAAAATGWAVWLRVA